MSDLVRKAEDQFSHNEAHIMLYSFPCRYILVDWLAEVAAMKEFSSLTFHVAVSVVDRFLRVHSTTRSKLQLLGVSAMVLCSRYVISATIDVKSVELIKEI